MQGTHSIRWNVRRTPQGWEGEATIALRPGAAAPPAAVSARAQGRTRAAAVTRTLTALDAVTRSPLVSSMLPPGASQALSAARGIARAVARWTRGRRRAAVSGHGAPLSRREVERALRARGVPRALIRIGASCAG